MQDNDNNITTEEKSYAEQITRCHSLKTKNGVMGIAISVQGRGHVTEGHPCEDYSGINVECKYPVFAVADGHSCSEKSEYGSLFAVEAIIELLRLYDNKKFLETDVIRFFRNKQAYDDLLDIWFKKIYDREKDRFTQVYQEIVVESIPFFPEYASLTINDRIAMAESYGTTLLSVIVCPTMLICFAIGDGGLFLMNKDGEELVNVMESCDFGTVGDAVNTSMCDLTKNEFYTSIYPRSIYNGVLLMSDGLEKPWIDTGRFEKINELRGKMDFSDMDSMLYDFIVKRAHPVESDDVSVLFGEF